MVVTRAAALEIMQAYLEEAEAEAPAMFASGAVYKASWAKADPLIERASWWAQIAEALRELGRE